MAGPFRRSRRGRELLEAVLREIELWVPGARVTAAARSKNSTRVSFPVGEREVWIFLAGTPSDKMALIAMVTEIRRRMRAAGVEPPHRDR